MFTGIIETTAPVLALLPTTTGARLVLGAVPFAPELALGESVATNGCCLTVVAVDAALGQVEFDLLAETLRVTSLGALQPGARVNLERALRVGDRLSGHYVQGHVDTTGAVLDFSPHGNDFRFAVELPSAFRAAMIHRGSICIDGISLTVAELHEDHFVCWIIPHTREITHLGGIKTGQRVNLEFDVLAKYVQRLLETQPRH
jgi:riboflavin synthase